MAKRRRRSRVKHIPLTIGQDPSLWRFDSLQEALGASTNIIVELIRTSQPIAQPDDPDLDECEIFEEDDEIAAR